MLLVPRRLLLRHFLLDLFGLHAMICLLQGGIELARITLLLLCLSLRFFGVLGLQFLLRLVPLGHSSFCFGRQWILMLDILHKLAVVFWVWVQDLREERRGLGRLMWTSRRRLLRQQVLVDQFNMKGCFIRFETILHILIQVLDRISIRSLCCIRIEVMLFSKLLFLSRHAQQRLG